MIICILIKVKMNQVMNVDLAMNYIAISHHRKLLLYRSGWVNQFVSSNECKEFGKCPIKIQIKTFCQ